MKMFTKLALVSSMAISANAMAMQSMDDAALSAATGQDGINLGIGISKIEIDKVLIHDNDGLATDATISGGVASSTNPAIAGGTATAGAIVVNDISISAPEAVDANGVGTGSYDTSRMLATGNLADIRIDSDAGAGNGNTAFLNIAAKVSGLDISIGEIGVSASTGGNTGTAGSSGTGIRRGNDTANYNAILSGLTLKTGQMNANIQLGAAPQGAMIVLDTKMVGGLEIKDLGILDNSTNGATIATGVTTTAAGEIRLDSIKVADASGTDLSVDAKVSVYGPSAANNGFLKIVTGTTSPGTDVYIKGVHLGSAAAASIGDVEVQGMRTYYNPTHAFGADTMGTAITISGH
ncbi:MULTISPECIES: DUF6160 family protein [Acinetobacter]|uniref:Uncharacterized protein n=1 Tax=Acinetobacter higginsii TaxID=70347 RepID=N9RAV0_9GAMM|nr:MULTISPECIES: DUF6160 family protein [Acinetobacter]ENX55173.1 hypothetical protein F902_03787 [Acinetobacter higginsii]ENX61195.1 hypothetical protein F885_01591 [Acinetobacter higginsii]MCH7303323.1 pilus assembly protein FilA [Acinetobacter higginsii]MCH7318901.1 pilus assembly protein FilA [Acinetobacter higginsii]MCH7337977.1 pilus assembly protein FilA [Acinetobacter higginsii]